MKKLIYSSFLIAAAGLLLSSCSSQLSTLSITKRHYRSGYYVDMVSSKHKTESIVKEKKTSVLETTPVEQVTAASNISETTPVEIATSTIAPVKHKKNISKEFTASAIKHSASSNVQHTITPNTLTELKNIKAIGKSIAAENKSHNNNNHSLIWIILVIILILILLDLLLGWGLGSILYLLIVILIVLLLLRLLGMI